MPHYKNGQPAKVGELVHHKPSSGSSHSTPAMEVLGILISITPGADTCNGQVLPVARKYAGTTWLPANPSGSDYVTLKDCVLIGAEASEGAVPAA